MHENAGRSQKQQKPAHRLKTGGEKRKITRRPAPKGAGRLLYTVLCGSFAFFLNRAAEQPKVSLTSFEK